MTIKKIGVIGSGKVAQILAAGFIKHGYDVMMGSSHLDKLDEWKTKNTSAHFGTFDEAAKFGDIIILAVKGTAAEAIVKSIADHIASKTVIDTTNPIAEAAPSHGVLRYFTTMEESLMERLQHAAPKAKFVKAFNSVGNLFMVNPSFPDGKPTMFICGNDKGAKKKVTAILEQFGWESADFGFAESARAIEPLCILWCIPGMIRNEWQHAFKLLKM
jgi:8-hydroxy-5-deazaflavin:NADPH oxidoreductase